MAQADASGGPERSTFSRVLPNLCLVLGSGMLLVLGAYVLPGVLQRMERVQATVPGIMRAAADLPWLLWLGLPVLFAVGAVLEGALWPAHRRRTLLGILFLGLLALLLFLALAFLLVALRFGAGS